MKTNYKNPEARKIIMDLYENKLKSLGIQYEERSMETFAGHTHVIVCGPENGRPVVLLHGINAGSPVALEGMKGLESSYRIYAVDSIGQATKSAETRLPLNDKSYGKWLSEVMDGLGLETAVVIGVSYGAFLLQKLIQYAPHKIEKGIFIVPGGLVNGDPIRSLKSLSFPLIRFLITKKESDLLKFMDAFFITKDPHSVALQKTLLTQYKMDYRRPPLLRAEDVKELKAPVYALVAGDDVFFPGHKALERCIQIFKNFKGSHTIQHAKHIPDVGDYPEISAFISKCIEDKQ